MVSVVFHGVTSCAESDSRRLRTVARQMAQRRTPAKQHRTQPTTHGLLFASNSEPPCAGRCPVSHEVISANVMRSTNCRMTLLTSRILSPLTKALRVRTEILLPGVHGGVQSARRPPRAVEVTASRSHSPSPIS